MSIDFRPSGLYNSVMPKIVDHESFKNELAGRAAELFLRRGYSALGMREIAEQLGVSKSGLYHYFSGKQDLFDAASRIAVSRMVGAFSAKLGTKKGEDAAVGKILAGVKALDVNFRDEIALLTDYLRTAENEDNASAGTAKANEVLRHSIAEIVGQDQAALVLSLCYGFLLQRVLAPKTTDFGWFEEELKNILSDRKRKR